MPGGRHDPSHEVEKLRWEDAVSLERREPEGTALAHGDPGESDVHQLPPEHWLRQCAGQSDRQRGGIPLDLLGERLGQHEVGEREAPTRP